MTRAPLLLVPLTALMYGCLSTETRDRPPKPKSSPTSTAQVPSGDTTPPASDGVPPESITLLTLSQAFELADRSHPEIAYALAQVEAAAGRTAQAGVFPNPVAVARMEQAPFDGHTTEEAEYVAGLSQRIPLGNRLSAASQVGRLEEERLREELAVRRLEVHRRVQGAFATALYLDEVIKVQLSAVQITANGLAATGARLAAGDALPEDVARAEMEMGRARLELERAQSLGEQAQAELRGAMGNPNVVVLSLEGALEDTFELPTLESLSARLGDHPSVAVAEAGISVERARVGLAEVQRIPDVNLDLFYRRLEISNTNTFDIGIAIPLPLFDRNQGSIREAQASVAAAEARARSTRNELERELRQAHIRLTSALADARALREIILPRAEVVLRAFEGRYAAGDASLTEVLPIRREHTAIELAHLESLRRVMEAWAALLPYLPHA